MCDNAYDLFFCSSGAEVEGSPLMGPCATEEALSLIKEEEVLCCCNYVEPLAVHVTDDAASFMFQLRERRENKWTTQPLTPTWLFRGVVICLKFVPSETMTNHSLSRAGGHNEFFYLNFELGRFSGGVINFPWTMKVLPFFFWPFGNKPGHPVQWFSKWDEGKTH